MCSYGAHSIGTIATTSATPATAVADDVNRSVASLCSHGASDHGDDARGSVAIPTGGSVAQ